MTEIKCPHFTLYTFFDIACYIFPCTNSINYIMDMDCTVLMGGWDPTEWLEQIDCQCQSRNSPGINLSIFRPSGVCRATNKAVFNNVLMYYSVCSGQTGQNRVTWQRQLFFSSVRNVDFSEQYLSAKCTIIERADWISRPWLGVLERPQNQTLYKTKQYSTSL